MNDWDGPDKKLGEIPPGMPEPPTRSQPDITDARCDQALQMCDGSPRATIKAVLLANDMQADEIASLKSQVEELKKALEFYRDEWCMNGDGDSSTPGLSRMWMEPTDELLNDEGRKAREALAMPLEDRK